MNMPLVLLNRRRRGGPAAFSPTRLFALAEPGVWYDPSDVANLNWRRNLLTWTEQFDNAVWTKGVGATVSANTSSTTDPIGGNTADVLSETSATNFHFLSLLTAISFAATQYTFTAYLKEGSSRYGGIHINDGTARGCSIDLQTGTLGTPYGSATASREALPNGWYKLTVTATASATASGQVAIYISNSNSLASYAGNTANNIYIWGAQLELGSVATDYQRISDVNTEVIERFPSATLYQDTAGTQPVTTPGQTVALALDKSKGLVLGSEQIVNGSFSADTDWTKINGATISGGVATLFNAATNPAVRQVRTFTLGRTYLVSLTWTGTISAGMGAYGSGDIRFLTNSTLGSWTGYVTLSAGTGFDFWVQAPVNSTATVDNISVRELPGFHATQATAASRPTYGVVPRTGRRNLLTRTEEFDNAVWAKTQASVTANAGAAPDGTMTADVLTPNTVAARHFVSSGSLFVPYVLSVYAKANVGSLNLWLGDSAIGPYSYFNLSNGTIAGGFGSATISDAGNGWYRCSLTVSTGVTSANTAWIGASVGTNATAAANGTDNILIWGAQLETGSTATAYQRVGSAFDVTEAGVPSLSYLSFDGVDDFLVTPTITPGTDKAQVFAGVRKLSDAAQGMIAEMSANSSANAGSFFLIGPRANATANYGFNSRGTVAVDATSPSSFASPVTNVLTGIGDISGDIVRLRVNGSQVAETLTDQGTGNFLAYPLYIGRRGGTTLPFNGQLYSLLVRFGTNLDAGTITSTETWVGGKTGIDIAKWISPTIFARDETAILDRFNATIERRAV